MTPTPEEIERGLTDDNWSVREAFALRRDYTPSPEQIERGLTDEHVFVREAFSEYVHWTVTRCLRYNLSTQSNMR